VTGGDTIFAPASGGGRRAVTVLRLSGPDCGTILDGLCRRRPPAREARLRRLVASDGEVLDRALVLWFPGPGSYTGEDSGELHLHGGSAVLDAVADALVQLGARPADPGEFTRRAFLNGRMDLLEAEAVADLVDAETAAQRRQALRQLAGELGGLYESWGTRLAGLMARQEALIDFPDEDLPPDIARQDDETLATLRREIASHLDDRRGERLRRGLTIAVTGPPNVGKSSLVNLLAGRDAAIVAALPGTTRDPIEVPITIADVPVILIDTAGLRETNDPVEAEGIRRARQRAEQADLLVLVRDARDAALPALGPPAALEIANKADLGCCETGSALPVSVLTGDGIPALRQRLEALVHDLTRRAGPPPLTRARHRSALVQTLRHLDAAAAADLPELRAEDLRLAVRGIGRITGRVGVEDLLGMIFSQFCIGK